MKKAISNGFKKVVIAAIVAFVATTAFAENADTKTENKSDAAILSLSGNIIDEASGEALVGVEVKVEGTNQKTYTDFDGHFVVNHLKSGDCKLVANYISYKKTEKTFQVGSGNNQVKNGLQASK